MSAVWLKTVEKYDSFFWVLRDTAACIILVEVFAAESIIDESFWYRRDFFVKEIGRELGALLNKIGFV